MADDILMAVFVPDRKGAVVSVRFSDVWRKTKAQEQQRIIQSLIDMMHREDERIAKEQADLAKGDKS